MHLFNLVSKGEGGGGKKGETRTRQERGVIRHRCFGWLICCDREVPDTKNASFRCGKGRKVVGMR